MITASPQTSLAQIFDALETGIIVYEPVFAAGNDIVPTDFAITYCNARAAEMNTVSHETMKVQRVRSLVNVPEEGRQFIFDQLNTVYRTGQQSVNIFHNTFLDRYFQQTRTKLGNAVLTEVKDVTVEVMERRERERQSAFSDQILDHSINGWFTCDAVRNDEGEIIDYIITRINAAFTRLIGLTKDAVVGKAYLSLFPTAKQMGTFSLNNRVLSSGVAERKLVHYVGDGFDAWYDIVASRLGANTLLVNFADISILGRAPYGIIHYKAVYDEKGNLVDFTHRIFNQVALDLAGLSFDEMSSKTAFQIADERNNRRLVETAAQVLKTGTPARFEYLVEKKATFVDLSLVPYEDGVLMNFIDITPRILQEQKVQQGADQLGRIIDSSLNAIYAWKAIRNRKGAIIDFKYTLVNKTFEKWNGMRAAEVIGKTALQLFPSLKGTALFDRYVRVAETGESAKFEDYYKGEGLDLWFEASCVRIAEDEIFISYRDITGQKNAALRLQEQNTLLDSILTNSPSGIVVVRMIRDESGTIVDGQAILMNEAAERFTQYPREVMLTQTSKQMEPHILESPVYQAVIKMMETGEPFQLEYQMEMTGQWVFMNVAKIDNDHLVNVFTDITENKKHLLEQDRMLHELKRSNEALEEFARAASHDLKEPIRKVQFFVSRLKNDMIDTVTKSQSDLFNRIEKASDRMRQLVEDLLEYSHLTVSTREKESVDLNDKLHQVLYDLEFMIREKGALVNSGPLPTINGYRRQLQQLFQNLVTNSLKYSRPGIEPRINITSTKVLGKDSGFNLPASAARQSFHLIEVRDNGIGFDAEHADRIFDVFTRLHGNAEYPGTGIGLSIVRKVAENHGGWVRAEGERNLGARFFILLPA